MAASASTSGAGIVSTTVSAPAPNGDQLEARWLGNKNIEIRKDQLNQENNGLYTISIIRIGG